MSESGHVLVKNETYNTYRQSNYSISDLQESFISIEELVFHSISKNTNVTDSTFTNNLVT